MIQWNAEIRTSEIGRMPKSGHLSVWILNVRDQKHSVWALMYRTERKTFGVVHAFGVGTIKIVRKPNKMARFQTVSEIRTV